MGYELHESPPTVSRFLELRAAAGMSERSREAVERGLPNTLYAVTVVDGRRPSVNRTQSDDVDDADETVGMARIVGDGGSVYHICDMVVHPDHQGRGLGGRMMDALMDWIDETAPAQAYVNLMADVDGFYEQWGFEWTAPASKGMYYRVSEA